MLSKRHLIYNIPFFLGFVSSFSLPPYNFLVINFIVFPALFFFLISNYKNSKWISFVIGWSFGFGYFISNLYWITNSLTFYEMYKPLIPFALVTIPLFLGAFYGLVTLLCSLFNLEKNFSSIFIFATVFSIIEFIRGSILGGFPWNLIAYSWTEYINSIQILSIIGTYSFNLLSITIFLIPSVIFFKYKTNIKFFSLIFAIIILIVNFFYGFQSIEKNEKINSTSLDFTIKVISPKIKISRYFQAESPEEIILDLIKISEPNNLEKTIFIFPEGALSNIYLEDLKNYSYFFSENFSDKHKIILGINSRKDSNIYNSMVVIDKNLNIITQYNKNKLVPFGEFLPLENFLSKFGLKKITQGYQSFSSAKKRNLITLNNINFLPLICYEIIYSGNLKKKFIFKPPSTIDENFDLIVNISEDGWFGGSIGPYQHFSHSIFRSIEEGKNLIRSANNGISAFINPKGQIIKQIESTKKGVIEIKSLQKTKNTFFSSYGNKIFFYFLLFYITLIFFLKKRKETK